LLPELESRLKAEWSYGNKIDSEEIPEDEDDISPLEEEIPYEEE
jgi:hypothetical protein